MGCWPFSCLTLPFPSPVSFCLLCILHNRPKPPTQSPPHHITDHTCDQKPPYTGLKQTIVLDCRCLVEVQAVALDTEWMEQQLRLRRDASTPPSPSSSLSVAGALVGVAGTAQGARDAPTAGCPPQTPTSVSQAAETLQGQEQERGQGDAPCDAVMVSSVWVQAHPVLLTLLHLPVRKEGLLGGELGFAQCLHV